MNQAPITLQETRDALELLARILQTKANEHNLEFSRDGVTIRVHRPTYPALLLDVMIDPMEKVLTYLQTQTLNAGEPSREIQRGRFLIERNEDTAFQFVDEEGTSRDAQEVAANLIDAF